MPLLAPTDDPDSLALIFGAIAVAAGVAVMDIYGRDAHARLKRDRSPVCDADIAAEALIAQRLRAVFGRLPIIAEEAASRGKRAAPGSDFLLIDALDGTREFLARNGEFTLNIALARDHAPVAGAVFAPASHRLWCAGRQARACRVAPGAPLPAPSEWRDLAVRRAPAAGLTALVSRSREDAEAEALLARLPIAERRAAGSSLKFCLIAEGEADVYPRFGRTMEWDTAAGDAILRAAGGCVLDPQGRRLAYGKTASAYANGPFVAWGDRTAAATLC